MKEEKRDIIVLDEGTDMDKIAIYRGFCCWGPMAPFR